MAEVTLTLETALLIINRQKDIIRKLEAEKAYKDGQISELQRAIDIKMRPIIIHAANRRKF